jgi:hypothetical protein
VAVEAPPPGGNRSLAATVNLVLELSTIESEHHRKWLASSISRQATAATRQWRGRLLAFLPEFGRYFSILSAKTLSVINN